MIFMLIQWVATIVTAFITGYVLTRPKKVARRNLKEEPYAVEVSEGRWENVYCEEHGLVEKPDAQVATMWDLMRYAAKKRPHGRMCGTRRVVKVHTEKKKLRDPSNKDKTIEKEWRFNELSPYEWTDYESGCATAAYVGLALRSLGLGKQENVGICDDSCDRWTLTAYGCYSQSLVVLTVYVNLGELKMVAALQEGEVKVFQTNAAHLKSVAEHIKDLSDLRVVIVTDGIQSAAHKDAAKQLCDAGVEVLLWEDILARGKNIAKESGKDVNDLTDPGSSDELAMIMYTSGSTGAPKGVMITHGNVLANIAASALVLQLNPDDVYLSYLPLAHVLALVIEAICIYSGVPLGYGSPRSLLDSMVRNCKGDLAELRPTVFPLVPAVATKLRKAVEGKLAKSSVAKTIFDYFYRWKLNNMRDGYKSPVLDAILFNKIKGQLGGRVRAMVSGGAPLLPDTHDFLRVCFGCHVLQGYGLTETAGGAAVMYQDDLSTGTCGPPTPASAIKLIDAKEMGYSLKDKPNPRGEVVVVGKNVTRGYYKNDEKTAEEFTHGGFRTGDIGEILPGGVLKIIDRRKNLIKVPHGEYIAIEMLESVYKASPGVDNICVVAESNHNEVIALIHPEPAYMKDLAKEKGCDVHQLYDDMGVVKIFLQTLAKSAKEQKLKGFEFIKNVRLCEEEWTPENNCLTGAMKLNRNEIKQIFKDDIDEMFSEFSS
mmetsp:Transcript_7721/g.21906  ORF Transcript_7721/g.21906 Transcript_7721/m.21906 type:complete len:711 (+) Transcript_7721:62-2194(+)